MGLFTILGLALLMGVAGSEADGEAKKINDETEKIKKSTRKIYRDIKKSIKTQNEDIKSRLFQLAQTKKEFCGGVLLQFFNTLKDKYIDFDCIDGIDSSFDHRYFEKKIDLKKLDEEIKELNNYSNTKISDDKVLGMTLLGTAGVTMFSGAAGVGAALPTIFGSAFLGTLPVVAGAAVMVSGALNKKRAMEEHQSAIEENEEALEHQEESREIIENLKDLNNYIFTCSSLIRKILDSFTTAYNNFELFTNSLYKDKKIKLSKLDPQQIKFVKNVLILSSISYASIDLPMLSIKGTVNTGTQIALEKTYNEISCKPEALIYEKAS